MYIEADVLGGQRLMECAIIEGHAIKTLVSLNLWKKWNMILQSFPYENLSDFVDTQQKNKGFQAYYSSLYEMQALLYQESTPLRERQGKQHQESAGRLRTETISSRQVDS